MSGPARDYEARYHRLRNRIVVVVTVELIAVLVFLIIVGGAVLSQSQENHDALVILQDATTPGGKLHDEGQLRTTRAVGQLIDAIEAGHLVILNKLRAEQGEPPLTEFPTTPSTEGP